MKFKKTDLGKTFEVELTRHYGPYWERPWLLQGKYVATLDGITMSGEASSWNILGYAVRPADTTINGQPVLQRQVKTKPKIEVAKVIPIIIGKIWLTTGEVLSFAWYTDFFSARAYFEKYNQLAHATHSVWGTRIDPPTWGAS